MSRKHPGTTGVPARQRIDLFISHAGEDSEVATAIATGVEARGFRAWYYERDVIIGPKHLDQTRKAVRRSKAIVVIVSPASLKSNQVTTEIQLAHELGKDFMPLLLGLTWEKFKSRRPLWAQLFGPAAAGNIDPAAVDKIVERLLVSLDAMGIVPDETSTSDTTARKLTPPPVDEPNARRAGAPFDEKGALDLDEFAFPLVDGLWRASKRMTIEERKSIDVPDLILGLLRRGPLTRALATELGAQPDGMYDALVGGLPRAQDIDNNEVDLILERARMTPPLVDVLVAAAARTSGRSDPRIYEHDLLAALCASDAWTPSALPGLPDPTKVREFLDRREKEGSVPWNGNIPLDDLDEDAKRVVYSAHVMAQQQGQDEIGQRIFLAAFLRKENGIVARCCSALKIDPCDVASQLFHAVAVSGFKMVFEGGAFKVSLSHDSKTFGLSQQVCARVVQPTIQRARSAGRGAGKITERDLFTAFSEEAAQVLRDSLAGPPLLLDLRLLASIDPDDQEFILSPLDRDATLVVRLAHAFAQGFGAKEISAPILLVAFFQMRDPESDVRRVLAREPRKAAEHMILQHVREGAPSRLTFDAETCKHFLSPLIVSARKIAGDEKVGQSVLFRALSESMPAEWNDRLRDCGVNLRELAKAGSPN